MVREEDRVRSSAARRCGSAGAASPRRSRTAAGRRRGAEHGRQAAPCRGHRAAGSGEHEVEVHRGECNAGRPARARAARRSRVPYPSPAGGFPCHPPTRARSSVDRALASGARGRRFESCRARAAVARGRLLRSELDPHGVLEVRRPRLRGAHPHLCRRLQPRGSSSSDPALMNASSGSTAEKLQTGDPQAEQTASLRFATVVLALSDEQRRCVAPSTLSAARGTRHDRRERDCRSGAGSPRASGQTPWTSGSGVAALYVTRAAQTAAAVICACFGAPRDIPGRRYTSCETRAVPSDASRHVSVYAGARHVLVGRTSRAHPRRRRADRHRDSRAPMTKSSRPSGPAS